MRAPKLLLALVAVASVATLATPAAWSWPGYNHSSWYNNGTNGYSGVNPMAAVQNGYYPQSGFSRLRNMMTGSNYGYGGYGSGISNVGYAPTYASGISNAYNPMYGSGMAVNPYSMMGGSMMGNGMMGNGMMGNGMGMFRHHHHHHYWQ